LNAIAGVTQLGSLKPLVAATPMAIETQLWTIAQTCGWSVCSAYFLQRMDELLRGFEKN